MFYVDEVMGAPTYYDRYFAWRPVYAKTERTIVWLKYVMRRRQDYFSPGGIRCAVSYETIEHYTMRNV